MVGERLDKEKMGVSLATSMYMYEKLRETLVGNSLLFK